MNTSDLEEMPIMLLTQRELDCIIYALQGKNIVQIAEALTLSMHSVRFYLINVEAKLGIFVDSASLQKEKTSPTAEHCF